MTGMEKEKGSEKISQQLVSWPLFTQAKSLLLYLAMDSEPSLDVLMQAAFAWEKQVSVPQILPGDGLMTAVNWQPTMPLEQGRFGIRQIFSADRKPVSVAEIDLVIVPCLALDRKGYRLGMGGGYYDRFLPNFPATAVFVGVCWQRQLLLALPVEEHDQRLHYVLTEEEFFKVVVQDGN